MENPFLTIECKLQKLENLLIHITEQKTVALSPHPQKDIIKIDEAVELTGYKKGYIYELVHRNAIPFLRIGRSLRFSCEELTTWIKAGRPDVLKKVIKSM